MIVKIIDQLIAMEITRDELLESAATEVHSTTPTMLDPIERPSKKKKKASQHERILAHKDIFDHHDRKAAW